MSVESIIAKNSVKGIQKIASSVPYSRIADLKSVPKYAESILKDVPKASEFLELKKEILADGFVKKLSPKYKPTDLWQKIIDKLPNTKGVKVGFELTDKNTMRFMSQGIKNERLKTVVDAFLKRARNPRIKVAFKNSEEKGYAISQLKLYDGKSAVGTCAISMTNPGEANNIVKARLSLGRKGKACSASGFVEGGQKVDLLSDNISISTARKAGKVSADAVVEGKAGIHTKADTDGKELNRVAQYFGESKVLDCYIAKLQNYLSKPTDFINSLLKFISSGKRI